MEAGADVDVRTGRLPPGQRVTDGFPLVGERSPSAGASDARSWRLEVVGLTAASWHGGIADLDALGATGSLRMDVHCVTGWSRFDVTWTGVPIRALLDLVRPDADARWLRMVSDSPRDHDTSLDLPTAARDAWLVWELEGAPLPRERGGPLRVVTTSRYFYKSCKWVRRLEVLAEDRPGFWERTSAYHPVGDPRPGDQRFATGSRSPAQVHRLLTSGDLAALRDEVFVGVDLRGWEPPGRDLRGLACKGCDLRDAVLAGRDLREANLSLSDLRGADLRGADLRSADLEGANLVGADLSGADLRDAALTATRLVSDDHGPGEPGERGPSSPARLDGADLRGASGLLEADAAYLSTILPGWE